MNGCVRMERYKGAVGKKKITRGSSFHKVGVITPVKSHEHVTRFAHVIHM